jgi:hypothetical protein
MAMHQVEVGAVGLRSHLLLGSQPATALARLGQAAAPLAVLAVEHQDFVADIQPHDGGQVARLVDGGRDAGADLEGMGNEKTDHGL